MIDYERLYYYETLNNDDSITIRLPKDLKQDFIKIAGGQRQYAKLLRHLMARHISNEIKHSTPTI